MLTHPTQITNFKKTKYNQVEAQLNSRVLQGEEVRGQNDGYTSDRPKSLPNISTPQKITKKLKNIST